MDDEEHRGSRRRPYRYTDWSADRFRGPPPWRRGFQPAYFVLIGLAATALLVIVVVAASR